MMWRRVLSRLPLPMLALSAAYGVWAFNMMFLPFWFAIASASAFELVYIGLSVVDLDKQGKQRAGIIAGGAVLVSVFYNSLAGLFHIRPEMLIDKPLWADVILAILHGLPLAVLAYHVSQLLLHSTALQIEPAPLPEVSTEGYTCDGCGKELGASSYGGHKYQSQRAGLQGVFC